MQTVTTAYNPSLDPYATWPAANGAAYCQRLSAVITLMHCKQQQTSSYNDLRCRGCCGLFNQSEVKPVRPLLSLIRPVDQIIEAAEANEPKPAKHDEQSNDFAALDAIIEGFYEEPNPDDDFDDVELELDDEQLLALFPELADDNEIWPAFTEYQSPMPRYAVYRGRCKKCSGYMENFRERNDDNVFRCLVCGWRTGPDYEQNRTIHAAGGVL